MTLSEIVNLDPTPAPPVQSSIAAVNSEQQLPKNNGIEPDEDCEQPDTYCNTWWRLA